MGNMVRVTFTFDGKRYYVKGKTKQDAAVNAALKKADLERGRVQESRISVNTWWDEYITLYKTNASDKTIEDYQSLYRNAIAPYIGSMQIKAVKPADCQRIMNRTFGKSRSYVRKVGILLSGLFKAAEDNDLINKSPYRGITAPKAEEGSNRALTEDERELFTLAAAQCGMQGLFFLVIYYCGLRPSEVGRIEAGDIDLEHKILRINKGKTKAAVRQVPIPEALTFPELNEGKLFLTAKGQSITKSTVRYWWKTVTRKMEEISGSAVAEDLKPYCLRHDYCTRLQEASVPIDVSRRIMGHSSIEVTSRIYTHQNMASLEDARAKINAQKSQGSHLGSHFVGAQSDIQRHKTPEEP